MLHVCATPSPPRLRSRGAGTRANAKLWKSPAPVRPTPVYDVLWRFAAERQAVLLRRVRGQTPPWTEDAILRQYRFTNAYRAADRVSQYLIRRVIYDGAWGLRDTTFRVLLFKLFNKIETWEHLERRFGPLTYDAFDPHAFATALEELRSARKPIYSGAYIMPPVSTGSGTAGAAKHAGHLLLLKRMMEDALPDRLGEAGSLQSVYAYLLGYDGLGPFLAFQYAIDLNYARAFDFSEMSFVVPGPGALDGMKKCFSDTGGLSPTELIRWVTDRQEIEFERLGLQFERIGDRPLQLIDVQNLFCEVSKYSRVSHPHVVGTTARSRIKQSYRRDERPLSLFFPPKWGVNGSLPRAQSREGGDHASLFGRVNE